MSDSTSRRAVAAKRARNHAAMWEMRNLIKDLVGPDTSKWPRAIYRNFFLILKPSDSQLFALTVFLLANSVSPAVIREYYEVAYIFSDKKKKAYEKVLTNYRTSNWTAWSVADGRSIKPFQWDS
jgi:hypothetical protein